MFYGCFIYLEQAHKTLNKGIYYYQYFDLAWGRLIIGGNKVVDMHMLSMNVMVYLDGSSIACVFVSYLYLKINYFK